MIKDNVWIGKSENIKVYFLRLVAAILNRGITLINCDVDVSKQTARRLFKEHYPKAKV